MNFSIQGVVSFLQDNDNLIKQLMETAEVATQEITELAGRVDRARGRASTARPPRWRGAHCDRVPWRCPRRRS